MTPQRRRRPPGGRAAPPGDIPSVPTTPPGTELPRVPPGRELVDQLDPGLPLVLFPVRLATRFHRPDGPGTPATELYVRIFPDALHADSHVPALTPEEVVLGNAYWERLRQAAGDAARADAHGWLVSQLGAPRGAWVAAGTESKAAPGAPEPPRPVLARLLPDRWFVRISQNLEWVEEVWSKPVRRDLAMAPNVAEIPEDAGIRDLLDSQDLSWMVDFDDAVEAGMAVRVPLSTATRRRITELIVFGVRDEDPGAVAELAGLLDAHRFSTGLEIVPQGTPTNATVTVDAGYTDVPADLDAFMARQREEPGGARPSGGAVSLPTAPAAEALALALGLDGPTAFSAAEYAGDRAGSRAAAMNRVLWPATWAHYLRALLATGGTPIISGADLDWVREWFRDWVRGGGPLPAFRAGEQPYGVLPVTPISEAGDFPDTPIGRLQALLADVRLDWFYASGAVAGFAVPATRTPEEEAVVVASVLGAVPHPTAFRLRRALHRYTGLSGDWQDGLDELERLAGLGPSNFVDDEYHAELEDPIEGGTVSEQSSSLARMRDVADSMAETNPSMSDELGAVRDHVDEVMRPATAAHAARAETRTLADGFSGATLPDPSDPALWYVEYGDDDSAADGTFPELRLVPGGDPLDVAESLRGLAADARSVTETSRPAYDHSAPKSLLRALVEHGIEQVAPGHASDVAAGLDTLATMCEAGTVEDPAGELEQLLRETLGLATHRLDAWITSVATQRLADLRGKRPGGVQIGGYGWLTELRPDTGGPDTQGFIHAPSLDHAATAAVLRSAWLACAGDTASGAFSVDLSSDRIRRAEWLLEGVRNGVELGELLGARFERRLHDAELDHLTADVREAVLAEAGHPNLPANGIVDGLALAIAYQGGDEGRGLRRRIDDLRAPLDGYPADGLLRALEESVADLDATADALMAQSVHSLVKGNLAEAGAALAASGSGDSGIPELRLPRVHREAQHVSHRVAAVFGGGGAPAASSVLGVADPALATWLASVLPRHEALTGLGLGAAEVVALASAGGELEGSRLGAVVEGLTRLSARAAATATVSLEEIAVVAGALRTAVGQARALRGEDLCLPADPSPQLDIAELDRRRLALADRLEDLATAPATDATLLTRVTDLVAVDDAGVIAALMAEDAARPEKIAAVLATAKARAAALRADLPDRWDSWSPAVQAEHLVGRIRAALALKLPVLPRFTPANAAELVAGAGQSRRRLGDATAAATWLLQVGRVHAGAGRVDEALALAAAVRGAPVTAEQVVQLPHHPDDPWVAVARPASGGPRTCVMSFTDLAAAVGAGAVSGLLFDAWTEPVPGPTATTGVAVHLDSPGAQPPQAVLVATVAPGERWSVPTLRTILSQTLQLAMIRAVGPESLPQWGHSLPAIFLPDGVAIASVEAEEAAG